MYSEIKLNNLKNSIQYLLCNSYLTKGVHIVLYKIHYFNNQKINNQFTFDLAAKETIVKCRSFLSCGGLRAGNKLEFAAKR